MIFVGLDLCEVSRFEHILKKYPSRISRIFTEEEIEHAERRKNRRAATFAACWAAREAAVKALGCGFSDGILFCDISVSFDEAGAPHLVMTGEAEEKARELSASEWSVSLTHERGMAAAVVVGRK